MHFPWELSTSGLDLITDDFIRVPGYGTQFSLRRYHPYNQESRNELDSLQWTALYARIIENKALRAWLVSRRANSSRGRRLSAADQRVAETWLQGPLPQCLWSSRQPNWKFLFAICPFLLMPPNIFLNRHIETLDAPWNISSLKKNYILINYNFSLSLT